MAPTIVFDEEGKPWAALGSPGGPRIILYVVKTLVALIDWKLDAQQAVSLMNFGSRGERFEIEVDHRSAPLARAEDEALWAPHQRRFPELRHARDRHPAAMGAWKAAPTRGAKAWRGETDRRPRECTNLPSPLSAPASPACGRR